MFSKATYEAHSQLCLLPRLPTGKKPPPSYYAAAASGARAAVTVDHSVTAAAAAAAARRPIPAEKCLDDVACLFA